MQLKTSKNRNMASLKDEEQSINRQNNNNAKNNSTNNITAVAATTSNSISSSNNNNNEEASSGELKAKRESLEARKQALEQRLSEKSWLLQQIQKQEAAIMHGNYEHMTINEFFAQLAQQYKHEQQLQVLSKESNAILRRKQSTTSRESHQPSNSSYNRHSETLSNRSSEYDNYQPAGTGGDMLVIGIAQQQAQQQLHVKSALKKRPAQIQYMSQTAQKQQQVQQQQAQQQQQNSILPYQQTQTRSQSDVISLYSANSTNVAMLRQQHVAPQQQPVIVQCDKYYLSPTHQNYNEGGFIKSSQNIKKYVSPLASPSNISYELQPSLQPSMQHLQHQRQLDAISLAPSYMSMDTDCVHQQFRWRSQSHIPPLTPPQQSMPNTDSKSQSSDMLSAPATRYVGKVKPLDEISLSSLNTAPSTSANNTTSIEKKPKPKQWLESSLDGPAVIRQMEPPNSPTCGGSAKPRTKLSSQSMSVSGRHYSMSSQRQAHNYPTPGYAAVSTTKALQHSDERYAKLSQSTSYLNAMEQTLGISASYPLEPLDIPPFRNLPPKPNQTQQPTPPPRPPPVQQSTTVHSIGGSSSNTILVSPPLVVATASLSPDIRIESPKNMTVVQQATFQPYKEVTKPFEMSDFYKYSTKFKQKDGLSTNRAE